MNFNSRIDRAKCIKAGIDEKIIEKLFLIDNGMMVVNIPILLEKYHKFWRMPYSPNRLGKEG